MPFTSRRIAAFFERSPIARRPVILVGIMALFWAVFDSVLSYLTPLYLEFHQYGEFAIGLIIGSSSIAGALFDFIVSRLFSNTSFRRMFLLMLLVCSVYPLILFNAEAIWVFLFAMVLWGVYYDLFAFGVFNFVSTQSKKEEFTKDFGIIQILRSVGVIIAPLVIGLLVTEIYGWNVIAFVWGNLFIAILAFFVLAIVTKRRKVVPLLGPKGHVQKSWNFSLWTKELRAWTKIGAVIAPALVVSLMYHITEAFFWTIGPLYGDAHGSLLFGALFLAADTAPGLFVGWYINRFTLLWGKKRVAFVSLLCSGLILSLFALISQPWAHVVLVLCASLFMTMAVPAINGAISDYVSETPELEKEIIGLADFSSNVAWVIGPIAAGGLAQLIDIPRTFTAIGMVQAVVAIILLLKALGPIRVPRGPELEKQLTSS